MSLDEQLGSEEQHESYGMIGFSRVTHGGTRGGTNLFASSINHHNTIIMRIKRATKRRSLHEDRYYGGETLIEVEMSPMQFAEAITTLNVGDGIPCTLRRLGKTGVADCPEETMRQRFVDEFSESCDETSKEAIDLINRARTILGQKTIKAAERKELLDVLEHIKMTLASNLPFVAQQFNTATDKVVTDARSSVEAFFLHRINELGIESLQNGAAAIPHGPVLSIEATQT